MKEEKTWKEMSYRERLTHCPVCLVFVGARKAKHFKELHPEYEFTHSYDKSHNTIYACKKCGATCPSYSGLVYHWDTAHLSTAVKERESEIGVITDKNVQTSDLDKLLARVNQNIAMLQGYRKQVDMLKQEKTELLRKCTEYATKIVELQNMMALDSTRNH